MYKDLAIISYPDPRLRKVSQPIDTFDGNLRALADRMFELMREDRGVGLAAPQVGLNVRLFVLNHSGKPEDDKVYVNPILTDATGEEEGEEGCLSLPDIHGDILRARTLRIDAQDLDGKPFTETETGYKARIWQHETDHLNGTLIIDRMGPTAKMAARKKLKQLEEDYAKSHPPTPKPTKSAPKKVRR